MKIGNIIRLYERYVMIVNNNKTKEVHFCSHTLYQVTYIFTHPISKNIDQLRSIELYREIKLMKGKSLRKHSLYEKMAASVLLKLFISSYEKLICVCNKYVYTTVKSADYRRFQQSRFPLVFEHV